MRWIYSLRRTFFCASAIGMMLIAGCGIFGNRKNPAPYGKSGEVQFEAAYRMILEGQYKEASDVLVVIAETKSSKNTSRPEAMFWLAYAYEEQGLTLEAREWYRHYLAKYPDQRYAPTAQARLAELE